MPGVNFSKIPQALRERPQWVLWKTVTRGDKPTKVPFQTSGQTAKANDPATWTTFDAACAAAEGYDGVGFEFSADDPLCGIDLDGCRDPDTGELADWARAVILRLDSYAEVSPSGTGVKIFCLAKWPFDGGKKVAVDAPAVCDKQPAIEVYDRLRYFAVTGMRLRGPAGPAERQEAVDWLAATYWPAAPQAQLDFRAADAVLDRARKYVAKMPPAVSGQGGHNATFRVACALVLGFELAEADALAVLREYSAACQPPWSERELLHKVTQAAKQTGPRGYLRYAAPERWAKIEMPSYREVAGPPEPRETTLADAARAYVDSLRNGKSTLISLGIPDLDFALGGGVEKGELVILAARPSHGKSAVGLQCVHHWTEAGMPCAFISEEMSALALGKRTVQFVTRLPQEHWYDLIDRLDGEIADYAGTRAKCLVLEGCGTADVAAAAIDRAVQEHGVECVVVDYAQLLGAAGKDRYQQMTSMSIRLRQLASTHKVVLLALCQMSRNIDTRNEWVPRMSDIKETGQLEQDADVILFCCWPHRLDATQPQAKFEFFLAKNRNREIKQTVVTCTFNPERQTIRDTAPEPAKGEKPIPW